MSALAVPTPALGRHRLLLHAALLLGLLQLAGCAQFATFSESMFMMSPSEEIQLGEQIKAEVNKEMDQVRDPIVTQYVRDLGQRIWANADQGVITPEFHVVENDEINAFAIPGGGIYIHTGTIKAARDEAELAAVMAHELGHIIGRHSARGVSRQMGVSTVQQILLGPESGQAAQLVTQLLSQGVLFNYSREDERQADVIAVRTLNRLGYDPLAMRSFFETLVSTYGESGSGRVASLFASHPPTSERMANVETMVQSLPAPVGRNRPTDRLRQIQARLGTAPVP